MKLRGKLVFLESAVSLIFLLSLLITLLLLNNGFRLYNYLETTRDTSNMVRKLIFDLEIVQYTENPTEEQLQETWKRFSTLNSLHSRIANDSLTRKLSPGIMLELENIRLQWQQLQAFYYPTELKNDFETFQDIRKTHNLGNITMAQALNRWKDVDESEQSEWQSELVRIGEKYRSLMNAVRALSGSTTDYSVKVSEGTKEIRLLQMRNILIFNLVMVLLSILIVYSYTKKLMNLIGFINQAMDAVAEGDLSARLRIHTDDEFGKLSRDFNTVVEILWSKLETVQNILEDVGKSISNEINLERAEKAILYLARKNSSADGVALFKILGEDTLKMTLVQGSYHPPFKIGEKDMPESDYSNSDELIDTFRDQKVSLDGNILGETARSGEATFAKRTSEAEGWDRDSEHPFYISSLINLPLRVGDRVLGVLSLVKNNPENVFSDLEFTNMLSFGELASISIDNLLKYLEMLEVYELNREIDIAADIQNDLLPQNIPMLPGLDLSLSSRTLRGINGDFYDAYLLNNHKLLVVVSEVAGKGVPAALVIIMLKTIVKLVASPDKNAAEIIRDLNLNITEKIKIENIATLSLMVIDSQNNSISYASAGHQPMIVYHQSTNDFEELTPKGIPVGLDKNAVYEEMELPFDKNNIYLQFTDGVPESRNRDGKIYGLEGVKKVVQQVKELKADEIRSEILDDLEYFQRKTKQWDDQTLFVMKREN